MKVLVTGVAGFIGSTLAHRLLERGDSAYGIDNLNDFYGVSLKKARLSWLQPQKGFTFENLDIADRVEMPGLFAAHRLTQ